MERFLDKVVFITGAARGQGRNHAVRFAEEGADIIAIDVCQSIPSVDYPMGSEADLAETVRQVEATGRRIFARKADVRDSIALTTILAEAVAEFGRLDIVCANAGVVGLSPAETMSDELWDDIIAINLGGVFKTARTAIPHLKAGGRGGSIIVTSSAAAVVSMHNNAHYVASKHGVVGLMKVLAKELAKDLIRVNAILPTGVNTPMIHNEHTYSVFMPDRDPKTITREDVAPMFTGLNLLPIPWVEPDDVTNAVLFLASDAARYMTGVQLPVDAGYTMP
jgi:SDR family mycofactocin-dependent oxidoreductase